MSDDDPRRQVPAREIRISDRLTRVEERLIAEKSVRKTRDDQLFKFISRVHSDLGRQEGSLAEISSEVRDIGEVVKGLAETKEARDKVLTKIVEDDEKTTAELNQITGSIKTLKYVIPFIITLIGGAITLLLTNIDTKMSQAKETEAAQTKQLIEQLKEAQK